MSTRMDSLFLFTSNTSFNGELLEDIERPAWSSVSLSESFGSHFTQTSSMFSESRTEQEDNNLEEGVQDVPGSVLHEEIHHQQSPEAAVVPLDNQFEDKETDVLSGNSQMSDAHIEDAGMRLSEDHRSISSSSRTLYASPRSSTGKLCESPTSRKYFEPKFLLRRGSLYRERAPSENALDYPPRSKLSNDSKSHSLQDVSKIPSHPHSRGSRGNLSGGQSRDSGFIHSESLLSLTGGGKNYDHVQSKVKTYIQNIKDADALRRKQRQSLQSVFSNSTVDTTPKEHSEEGLCTATPEELEMLVVKMKHDMEDKDRVLGKLQGDYDALLRKYAEAENRIDKLRFNCIGSPATRSHSGSAATVPLVISSPKPVYSNFNFERSKPRCLYEDFNQSCDDSIVPSDNVTHETNTYEDESSYFSSTLTSQSVPQETTAKNVTMLPGKLKKKSWKKDVIISAPLGPITKLYSTSVRLDRPVIPLTSQMESAPTVLNQSQLKQKISTFAVPTKTSNMHLGNAINNFSNKTVSGQSHIYHKMEKGRINSDWNKDKENGDCSNTIPAKSDVENDFQSVEEQISPPLASSTAKPIDYLPNEDPFIKVQRWQSSLPQIENANPCYSPAGVISKEAAVKDDIQQARGTSSKTRRNSVQCNEDQPTAPVSQKQYVSIGLQTACDDRLSLVSTHSTKQQKQNCPSCYSLSSEITKEEDIIGIVPRLNLDGFSDEHENYDDSLVISDCDEYFASVKGVKTCGYNCDGSLFSSKPDSEFKGGIKSWKRTTVSQKNASQHMCRGCCQVCGKIIHAYKKHHSRRSKTAEPLSADTNRNRPETTSTSYKNFPQMLKPEKKHRFIRTLTDASQDFRKFKRDEDHVVPSSPVEDEPLKYVGMTHHQGCRVNPHTHSVYVDLPCGTTSKIRWWCHKQNQCPSQTYTVSAVSSPSDNSRVPSLCQDAPQGLGQNEGDLLHCLDEMDEYASQMWAKTVSFLEVLEKKRHSTPY